MRRLSLGATLPAFWGIELVDEDETEIKKKKNSSKMKWIYMCAQGYSIYEERMSTLYAGLSFRSMFSKQAAVRYGRRKKPKAPGTRQHFLLLEELSGGESRMMVTIWFDAILQKQREFTGKNYDFSM